MQCIKRVVLFLLLFTVAFAAEAQNVFKTPSGRKYHLASCRMAKNVSKELTIAEAVQTGLEPCKICRPPGTLGIQAETQKAQGENITLQCNGQTKAGNRCKHMTSIANGYCYQHQPK